MVTFRGSLKPDDPLLRTNFLIFHPTPYNPGGEKPGTDTQAEPPKDDQPPQPKK
jgi:hypothetical protein